MLRMEILGNKDQIRLLHSLAFQIFRHMLLIYVEKLIID